MENAIDTLELLARACRKAQKEYYTHRKTASAAEYLKLAKVAEVRLDTAIVGIKKQQDKKTAMYKACGIMRTKQRKYYSNQDSIHFYSYLGSAKKAERQLDELLAKIIIDKLQPQLF